MILAVRESPPGRGVVAAEIDLQFVESVIKQARVGSAGYAYAVDSDGQLVAHPSIDLVLGRADFSHLPQVRAALSGSARTAASATATGRNWHGKKVLSAFQRVDPPGWRVFVEEPLSVAYAPLESSLVRTALLLIAVLALAVATSVLLARRMVRPITSMQVAAAKIGQGALDHRVDVTRTDELGMLGEEFNRMAARLQESYAGLEDKVAERTRDLATAMAARREERRARDRQPAQVGVPRQHVARAADAAERDHRLLRGAARADVRGAERTAARIRRRRARGRPAPARR